MAPLMISKTRLAAIAFAAAGAAREATAATVSCGGHFSYDCASCPKGNGETWCHGDCAWISGPFGDGQCVPHTLSIEDPAGTKYYGSSFLFSGIVMSIFACFYNQKVIKGPPPLPKVNSYNPPARRGLFECFWYPDTCLYTTFCLPVVAGKNYYAADVCPFWPGCILTFLGTYSPFYCITVMLRTCLSGKVQESMGMEPNCCMNCIYNAFCFPCDVGRESLEVDAEIGAEIKCCCQVKITPRVVAEAKNLEEKIERSCDTRKYRICGGEGH